MKKLLALFLLLATATGALAQNNLALRLIIGNKRPATVTFLQCSTDTVDATTYTFSAQNTGTPSSDRVTIAIALVEDGTTNFSIDTLTIGGDSASQVVTSATAGGSLVTAAIFVLANPSGTSEDVVVTGSEATINASVCLFQANNVQSTTATATNNDFETASAACTLDLNVSADGISVAGGTNEGNAATATFTGHTERADTATGEGQIAAGDYDEDSSASTPLTAALDFINSGDAACVSASFR